MLIPVRFHSLVRIISMRAFANAGKRSVILSVLILSLLCKVAPIYATGTPITAAFDGASGIFNSFPTAPVAITDGDYFYYKSVIRTPAARDIISFKINESSTLVLKSAFSATISYRLSYTDKDNNTTTETTDRILTINYDPAKGKTYRSHHDFIFDNAYGLSIVVNNLTITGASGWDPKPALKLSMDIEPNHLYQFDRVQNAVTQFTGATLNDAMPVADQLAITWNASLGASEYDLEWSYVDSYASAQLQTLVSSSNPSETDMDLLVYRNNASRVTLNETTQQYAIPLYYDGQGTLVYRIRSAQVQPNGQRLESVWSKSAVFVYQGHQSKLNWQASTSFAEEGKRKSVLQYFDGSLRNRQTVTKDNSTQTTVVAETIYDYQGRPAIQVLPAPTLQKLITYTPNFNSINSVAYDKDNFDLVPSNQTACVRPVDPLSSQSGAAIYYSPSNPLLANTDLLKSEPYHQFIPDAQGYPFTETQYMRDGTGRVLKQGGVGPTHQIGTNHETGYYYSNPDQNELDGLFGTEVGDASHYFKNMVRDANGQYSVSYQDMHGRTIATALAGDLPAGTALQDLESKNTKTITKTLTDPGNNLVKGWTIESSKGVIVTKAGTLSFDYSFNPSSLHLTSCAPASQDFFYHCLYDLEITVTGDCNDPSIQLPKTIKRSNFTLGQINAAAGNTVGFHESFDLTLPEGSYTVTKKLTISADGLNYYRDQVFMPNNLCKTLEQFIQEQKDIFTALNLTCNPTSVTCYAAVGSAESFRTKYLADNDITSPTSEDESAISKAYGNAIAECARLSANETGGQNELQAVYQNMLADVSPGGQYANLEQIDNYSIFSKQPLNDYYQYANSTFIYQDEQGNTVDVLGQYGTYEPNAPRTNANNFVLNFQPSWATSLVQLHPEFCKYQLMHDQVGEASYNWDTDFLNTKTYAEAQAKGYLNPTGNSSFTHRYSTTFNVNSAKLDPLSQTNSGYKNNIEAYLNIAASSGGGGTDNYSLWSVSSITGFCKSKTDIICRDNQKAQPFNTITCTADLDAAWVAFRGLYYAHKKEYIRSVILNNSSCSVDYTALLTTHTIPVPNNEPEVTVQHTAYFNNSASSITQITGMNNFETGSVDPNTTPQQAASQQQAYYANTCDSYTSLWWDQLKGCLGTKLADKKANILADLKSVCIAGSDEKHMTGASTISPAKTNTYNSFEAVIKHYVDQYNATASTTDRINSITCNGLLINFPLPYENILPLNKPVINKPDDCDCAQIAMVRGIYNDLPSNIKDASFSAYMLRVQHVTISNADLDMLTSLCTDPNNCKFIATPIVIPPGLQCGAGDVCVTCDKVNQVYGAFKKDYPGVIPSMEDVVQTQRDANRLFEKYMNSRLGFGKSTIDYLQFISDCGTAATGNNCDNLSSIVSGFNNRNFNTAVDTVHFGVTPIFQDDNNVAKNKYGQIFSNGYAHIDNAIMGGTGYQDQFLAIQKNDTLCVNNNFTIETRFKGDSADLLGDAYCKVNNFIFWYDDNRLANFDPTFEMAGTEGRSCGWASYSCANYTCIQDTTNTRMYYRNLLEWTKLRLVFKNNVAKVYINDSLTTTMNILAPINKIPKFAWGVGHGYVDYLRIWDSTGTLQYAEEFEDAKQSPSNSPAAFRCIDDCQAKFVQYFNQQKNTSYTYAQIDALYIATCGQHPMVCTVPQNDSCTQNMAFVKTYKVNTNGSNNFGDVIQTADGGYLATGTTQPSSGNVDGTLTKLDRKGNVEWSKVFGGTQDDYLSRSRATADGGYITVGTYNSFQMNYGDIWIMKTDRIGNKQWSKRINAGTANGELGTNVIQTADGGYVFCGYRDFAGGTADVLVGKLDGNGAMLWNRRYGSLSTDQPGGILEEGDSLVLTALHIGNSYYDGVLMKISQHDGSVGMVKTYDVDVRSNWFVDLYNKGDGYSICAYIDDAFGGNIVGNVLSVSRSGQLLQSVKVSRAPGAGNNGVVTMHPTNDGGFVMAQSLAVEGDAIIQKVDAAGAMEWANQIKIPGTQLTYAVIPTVDNSYAVSGLSNGDALIMKTDALGKTHCLDTAVSISTSFPSTELADYSWYYQESTPLVIKDSGDVAPGTMNISSTLCSYDPCAAAASSNSTTGPTLCGRNEALFKTIDNPPSTVCDDLLAFSTRRGMELYQAYKESLLGEFTNNYIAECMKAVESEDFHVTQQVSEYHYTLYYYDQAGNLVKTVPPAGVHTDFDPQHLLDVKAARAAGGTLTNSHTLATNYRYNTLNQVISQNTPDAKVSNFWYDRLGRLTVSQNAKQLEEGGNYSYTKYDYIGRITEVGQINAAAGAMSDDVSRNPTNLQQWLTNNANARAQITSTQYDLPGKDLSPYITIRASNLRSRVAFTSFTEGNNPVNYTNATYYDYDIHGNVATLLQDYGDGGLMATNGQQYKRMDYQYDLISGKVNQVNYQAGFKDQFFHRYSYDAENRITLVETSNNAVTWEKDAKYQYYKHGPLARTELGEQKVQGMDYAYTLQGWLKSVNGTTVHPSGGVGDMGGDGGVNRAYNALDVYGYSLHYYDNDYTAIGQPLWLTGLKTQLQQQNAYRPLFNGNISSMAVNLPVQGGGRGGAPMLYNYQYDQLNRLKGMDAFKGNNAGAQLWDNGLTATPEWKEQIVYDPNGNITDYLRHGDNRNAGAAMDNLHYIYYGGTNRLSHVTDAVASTPADYNDIKSQNSGNYEYDAIGNLVKDHAENESVISWNVYGKILQVSQTRSSGAYSIDYKYDAAGNRISKKVNGQSTFYVRDASGNTMAVYSLGDKTVNNGAISWQEQHLYGSSRLGIQKPMVDVSSLGITYGTDVTTTTKSFYGIFDRGKKIFELNNHLGNVLATISDKKTNLAADNTNNNGSCAPGSAVEDLQVNSRGTESQYTGRTSVTLLPGFTSNTNDEFVITTDQGLASCDPTNDNGNNIAAVYVADIITAQDYAPGGMQMPGRKYQASSTSSYRYSINGQEKETELNENITTALYWEYDSRIVRRWNLDPKSNPDLSSYAAFGNNPILMVDPLGDKEYKNYEAYKKALGNKAVAEKDWNGQDGNWLKTDRKSWSKGTDNRFSKANEFNITQKDGSNNYEDLNQRKDFYSWFQSATDKKGFETKWSGGAAQAVDKLEYLVDGWGSVSGAFGYSSKEIEGWVKAGNKLILDDVWGNLMKLYSGPILKGKDAYKWDASQLLTEQQVIDPSYWNLSNKSLTTLENSLKKNYFLSKFVSGPKFSGTLLSVTDRWVYGMTLMSYKVTAADVPIPAVCPQSPQQSKSTPQR